MSSNIMNRILTYGRMIKFSHTIFALPFALSAVVLAQRQYPLVWTDIFWVLLAMVGARSAAMGFNRIADARIDANNPRTSQREIPSGKLELRSAVFFVIFFSAIFICSAAMLGRICFYLAPPVLALLFFYSYTKRFTWLAHLFLGFAISLAPLGAWIAIAKTFSWPILLLSLALMTYIAGFDILYACQDVSFDQKEGLFSIPVHFGTRKALLIAAM
ncbi:MAG: 4-hydroxybenzoate octaprenyltransferase, partial [Desulfobacteraceae bacterium 4572_88]